MRGQKAGSDPGPPGWGPEDAIRAVRSVRPGAIESLDQERYLLNRMLPT